MHVVMVTEQGVVKRSDLEEYRRQGRGGGGVKGINVAMGDRVVGAVCVDGDPDILICTAQGMTIRMAGADVRAMGRTASGVRGIRLQAGDRVVAIAAAG
ncbi:hypothetical protein AMK68_05660 [candidate division KD3-62 bacterium DG_56]|uniref:DNA gyrase subunit A n=1 Tax=candidate division KD3-62 bacterium DG_56 TaxID=1704032 RepID=A0A0S7XHH6_9BACT|nr:MAG: hypothetical protein AMK68_05660 [candidate division KD3-62 bacterium DG_56]